MPIQFITPSIISSVANTQVTGTITASQIATVNASTVTTGTLPGARLPAGSVLQVVQGTTGTQVSTSGTTLIDTTLTATITPKFASSKILVLVDQSSCGKQDNERLKIVLLKNATQIATITELAGFTNNTDTNNIGSVSTNFLDSPVTTSATTYKTQFSNINGVGAVYVQWNPSLSTITLLEIAA